MSEVKKTIPKRRFKEFLNGDAWEQRELGDFVIRRSEMLSCSSEIPSVEYEDIVSGQGILNKDVREKQSVKTGIKFDSGEVLFGKLRPYLKNWILPDFTGVAVGDFWVLHSDVVDSSFLYNLIQTTSFQKVANQSTGTKMPRADWNLVSKSTFSIPTEKLEQVKIGKLLIDLDNLITLHQRKLEKIKALKKSYLSEMFPAEGETKPKRRFAGFTEDWEQCKFKNVFNHLQNNSLSRAMLDYEEGEVFNVHYGDILVEYGECLDVNLETLPRIMNNDFGDKYKASYLDNGDVIIADAAEDETVGKCCEIKGLSNELILSGLHTIPCRPLMKFATGYLGYFMNSNAYHDQLLPLMQGTKVSSISKSAIADTYIKYPKDMKEQEKIGRYFIELDNLITLHQIKLDKLQDLKKAYLKEMFV